MTDPLLAGYLAAAAATGFLTIKGAGRPQRGEWIAFALITIFWPVFWIWALAGETRP